MDIRQDLIDESRYGLKCPYMMNAQFLIVHNTANDASASNEIAYMKRNDSSTSYHIAIDDIEAIQAIPFDRNSWNCGDGPNGYGNRNGISIEICYSKSGGERWEKAKENAIELIAEMLYERGWDIEQVKKHQDFSPKYCPHRILDEGWDDFIEKIQEKLDEIQCDLMYQVHLQDIGWTQWIKGGEVAGTTGECRRMEAIKFKENNGLQLKYRSHSEDIGWGPWVNSGEVSGTTGECRRIESIEIESNKPLEAQEHIQDVGWMPVSRGTHIKIGTEGKALRLEAFKIKVM